MDAVRDGIIEACPPFTATLEAVRKTPFDTRCDAIAAAMEASFPLCPDADHAKIVTLYQLDPSWNNTVLTTLTTRPAPDAPPFEVRSDETWGMIVPRLQAAGPSTHWVVRPTGG